MKINPFKILLWLLFIVFVAVNSLRLFIYGFVLSFIIVIIDRAFFGTRKRSDTQFLNLFFAFTTLFSLGYSVSPYLRSLEFHISHPKWTKLEIVSINKGTTHYVSSNYHLEKVYTPLKIHFIDKNGNSFIKHDEIKHYAIPKLPPFSSDVVLKKELNYIHQRGLEKLMDKYSVSLYEHPYKDKIKTFKGIDGFALRHSIGSQISIFLAYCITFVLGVYCVSRSTRIKNHLINGDKRNKINALIVLGILLSAITITVITVIHYFKF